MMEFQKLSLNSRALLSEIVSAENPIELLRDKFKKASPQQDRELRGILRELGERNYLKIQWADNKPHHITINNSARTYEEQLAEYEAKAHAFSSQSITIGNNNKINGSTIAGTMSTTGTDKKGGFYENHPVICSVLISLFVGIVLLFSFWGRIISFIEGLF